MKPIIVTTGEKYTDIDGLACCVAYNELLNLKGLESFVVLLGPLNESVSKSLRKLNFKYETSITNSPKDYEYVLLDISDTSQIPKIFSIENTKEVYDHRWGFEDFWKEKLQNNSHIEMVGSCATLVYEKIIENNLQDKISKTSALLLYTAIISNTLNLKAQITNERDKNAIRELSIHLENSTKWVEDYFSEVSESVLKDPINAIKNDTKIIQIKNGTYEIMQIELWDSKVFISNNEKLIIDLISSSENKNVFLTSPSISEGVNYIVATDETVKGILGKIIDAKFEGNVGKTDKLWLRKEILRELAR